MKTKIKQICKNLENKHNIKILFAIENGSRVWRMSSKDSDYDVRLVFVRPLKEYLKITKPKEVIDGFYDKNGLSCTHKDAIIDISGFDIFKYVKMLSTSNPTTIEWLMSDIVYHGKQNKVFKHFATNNFSQIALYHHYKSLCKNNYLKYLKSGSLVTYKKYLYAYRGLLNAKWVVHKKTVPPIIFVDILKGMRGIVPDRILDKLEIIIELKSQGKEKDIIANISYMDKYIEKFLGHMDEIPTGKTFNSIDELNKEVYKLVAKEKC